VAVPDSLAPVVDQVEWVDASDSLPGAEPEVLGPAGDWQEDSAGQSYRSRLSPKGSSEGSNLGSPAPAADSVAEDARDRCASVGADKLG
jgi:hypothetical protein